MDTIFQEHQMNGMVQKRKDARMKSKKQTYGLKSQGCKNVKQEANKATDDRPSQTSQKAETQWTPYSKSTKRKKCVGSSPLASWCAVQISQIMLTNNAHSGPPDIQCEEGVPRHYVKMKISQIMLTNNAR